MTDLTIAQFRLDFPEFTSTTVYTDAMVTFWLNLAKKMLNQRLWCDVYNQGLELYMAHNLAIQAADIKAANAGGIPGQPSGPVAGKQVDKVSIRYDQSAAVETNAGSWNTTIYGRQFIRLARLIGAGCVQII